MFFGNFTHTLLAWIWRNQGAQGVWSGFNCIRFIGNTPKVIIHIRTTCFLKHPKIAFLAIFAIFDHLIPQLWAKMANCRQIPRVPKCFPLQSAYNEQPRSRVRWRNSIVTIVWPPLPHTLIYISIYISPSCMDTIFVLHTRLYCHTLFSNFDFVCFSRVLLLEAKSEVLKSWCVTLVISRACVAFGRISMPGNVPHHVFRFRTASLLAWPLCLFVVKFVSFLSSLSYERAASVVAIVLLFSW